MAVVMEQSEVHDLSALQSPSSYLCPTVTTFSCSAQQMQFSCLYCSERILISCQPKGHLLVLMSSGQEENINNFSSVLHSSRSKDVDSARTIVDSDNSCDTLLTERDFSGAAPESNSQSVIVKCEKSSEEKEEEKIMETDACDKNSILRNHKDGWYNRRKLKKTKHGSETWTKIRRSKILSPVETKPTTSKKLRQRATVPIQEQKKESRSFKSTAVVDTTANVNVNIEISDRDTSVSSCNDTGKEINKETSRISLGTDKINDQCHEPVLESETSISKRKIKKGKEKPLHVKLKIKRNKCDNKKDRVQQLSVSGTGSVSDEKRPMHCELCNKTVCGTARLKQHLKTHMNPSPGHPCDICQKSFKQLHKLKLHKSTVHDKVRAFMCVVCHKFLSSCSSLRDHMTTHQRKMADICHLCGKEFYFRQGLTEHLKVAHEGKRYTCPTCGKEFTTKNCLKTHKISHMDEVEKRKHCVICDICGKMFKERRRLNLHYRVHTDDKPYQCDICNKRYCQKIGLITHKKTHTMDKSHSCAACGEKFSHRSALTEHQKLHEQSHPPPIAQHLVSAHHHHPDLGVGRISHPPHLPPSSTSIHAPPPHPAPPPPPVCFVEHYPYYLYQ